MPRTFWVETLGCPKNQVDSDKLRGVMLSDGLSEASAPDDADVVVVNTCAFVEEARTESVDTILALTEARRDGAKVVVTGCMAERYGDELAEALPEVDSVVGFGGHPAAVLDAAAPAPEPVAVSIGRRPARAVADAPEAAPVPALDLLELARPASAVPWAYVKIAEGCDRACGFCAIPSFRGPQRSRTISSILDEVDQLEAQEIVLVAQDLAAFGRDQGRGERAIVPLVQQVAARVPRVRLLYLYPSDLSDELIDTICATGVPYFDLSLQHVSRPLMRRMRRWGDGERFLRRIEAIRAREPDAAFRSNFIVGYPGETEEDHDRLLAFVEEAQLDWCGFFAYSREPGTHADTLDGHVDPELMAERLAELRGLQDDITADRRDALIGRRIDVLVDAPGVARSPREAPEIDGIVEVPPELEVGTFASVEVVDAHGPDLIARPAGTSAGPGAGKVDDAMRGGQRSD
ncbi:MAG: 30S ribosomal protein S12 methylthiotransferase RimO [Actinomycetota bacterium]|nr:30S ribosomal protein S12 methylthiotransferase RimO [Actinomycetota bacterium]